MVANRGGLSNCSRVELNYGVGDFAVPAFASWGIIIKRVESRAVRYRRGRRLVARVSSKANDRAKSTSQNPGRARHDARPTGLRWTTRVCRGLVARAQILVG